MKSELYPRQIITCGADFGTLRVRSCTVVLDSMAASNEDGGGERERETSYERADVEQGRCWAKEPLYEKSSVGRKELPGGEPALGVLRRKGRWGDAVG